MDRKLTLLDTQYLNEWLQYAYYNDDTPREFVLNVCDQFLNDLTHMRLALDVTDPRFYKAIVQAICVFHVATERGERMSGPNRKPSVPRGWNAACEAVWMPTLEFYYFDSRYWERFWKRLYHDDLPDFYLKFSYELSAILPQYLLRNVSVLQRHKAITSTKKGMYVDWDTYESEAESDDN